MMPFFNLQLVAQNTVKGGLRYDESASMFEIGAWRQSRTYKNRHFRPCDQQPNQPSI